MFTKTIYAAGALAFVAGTQAHIVMNTPKPYGWSTLQSSPLNGEGYNFPCQSGSRTNAYDATGLSHPMVVGQNNDLKFTGSAVHGGGSCQLSVTYEYPPPADKSKWKVIQSFIGSCPAHAAGNIATGSPAADDVGHATGVECSSGDQSECIKSYQFQLPQGLKNGNATLAWTWFNKMGNREMYMNCAPISISGGSEDDTFLNSLPDIFVANIPGECTTSDGSYVIGFPNPGDNVVYGEAITPGGQGTCPPASSGNSGNSSSAPSSSVAATSSAVPTYAAPSSYAASSVAPSYAAPSYAASSGAPVLTFTAEQNAKTTAAASEPEPTGAASDDFVATTTVIDETTVNYTTMVTMTGNAPSTAAASVTTVPTSAAAAASSDAVPVLPTAASTGSYSSDVGNSSCGAGKVSCSSPGNIICIGESQFGLCNIDYCAIPAALAYGTTCTNGVIGKREISRRDSRMHRHAAGHIHKRTL